MCQKIWSEALDEASADVYAPWNTTRDEAYLIKDLSAKGWRKPEWKPLEAIHESDTASWRINIPDPQGVCTDPSNTVNAYKITADTIDPHFINHADPVEVRRARGRV